MRDDLLRDVSVHNVGPDSLYVGDCHSRNRKTCCWHIQSGKCDAMTLGLFILGLTVMVIGLVILGYAAYVLISSHNLEGGMFALICIWIGSPITLTGFVFTLIFGLLHFFGYE